MASNLNFAKTEGTSMASMDALSFAAQAAFDPASSTTLPDLASVKYSAGPGFSATAPMQAGSHVLQPQLPSYAESIHTYQNAHPTSTSISMGRGPETAQASNIFGRSKQVEYNRATATDPWDTNPISLTPVSTEKHENTRAGKRNSLNPTPVNLPPNLGSISSIMDLSGPEGGFPIRSAKQSRQNENNEYSDSIGKEDAGGPAPPWSELKTKAGKERKRLPLACIACRRKKIRCSGEKPACKHCLRSRIPCVYKVTTRKAAPRIDYMAMLDKRLKRMEERIIRIVPKDQNKDARVLDRGVIRPSRQISGTVKSTLGKKRAAKEAFGHGLHQSSGPQTDASPNHLLPRSENEEISLMSEGSSVLPSKEIQEYLVEVFFDNLYGQAYHLLHRPSFTRKLK
jgi:hypothetical protein